MLVHLGDTNLVEAVVGWARQLAAVVVEIEVHPQVLALLVVGALERWVVWEALPGLG